MAKKKTKSNVMAKLNKRAGRSWKNARETEAKAKGSQLPGGIVRGVAQLSAFKIDEDKKGNPYVFLTGTVQEPDDFFGLKATAQHFIKATDTKTVEDKLEGLVSDLKLLGADTVEESDIDDLPAIIEGLVEEAPFFFFNTWAPDDGNTFVFIQGLAEDFEPEEGDEEEPEDGEEEEEEEEEEEDEGDMRVVEVAEEDEEEKEECGDNNFTLPLPGPNTCEYPLPLVLPDAAASRDIAEYS